MHISLLTLFPEFFDGPLRASILGRAVDAGLLSFATYDVREHTTDKHRTVDDTPYGGGAGMVMRATEIATATRSVKAQHPDAPVIMLSPQGPPLQHETVKRLAQFPSLILVCGRYEGIDERYVRNYVDAEVSVGDFVLTGGEPAALCLIDAVSRFVPGVLGNAESAADESFSGQTLEYPQFTRPADFEGLAVPPILLSGHHARIDAWRRRLSLERTRRRRPDLWQSIALSKADHKLLADPSLEFDPWMVDPKPLSSNE